MATDMTIFDRSGPAEAAKCPRCDGMLHPYAATCFGCDHERGTAYFDILEQWELIRTLPVETLTTSEFLGEVAAKAHFTYGGTEDPRQREILWYANRGLGLDPDPPNGTLTGSPITKFNYLGGLESHPHSEYGQMRYADGVISLTGDRSGRTFATIPLDRLLGVTAYPTVDQLLGGRTFGLIGDNFAVFQHAPTSQGGAIKFVFADEQGFWRVAAIGSRTGITDKLYTFDYCDAVAGMIRLYAQFWIVRAEWNLGPTQLAASLGFRLPARTPEPEPAAQAEQQDDVAEALRKLKGLLDSGLITVDDYNAKKSEILARI